MLNYHAITIILINVLKLRGEVCSVIKIQFEHIINRTFNKMTSSDFLSYSSIYVLLLTNWGKLCRDESATG